MKMKIQLKLQFETEFLNLYKQLHHLCLEGEDGCKVYGAGN